MVSAVFFSVFGQLLRPFSLQVRYCFIHYWARFCVWWLKLTCGISYRVQGQDNLDLSQTGLLLARHESTWETMAFQKIFPRQTYVLKKELLRIPFFGWGLAMLNPISIDRNAGRQAIKQVVNEGLERLQKGVWVIIFPEGTRMASGTPGKIKPGGALLAQKAKVPVYLVAHNAGRFWPKSGFIKTPGVVDIYISPPLDVENMTVAEINQKTEEWFSAHLDTGSPMALEAEAKTEGGAEAMK
ncbi:MAG: lysophospholipid acyltransferase family protein [Hydrogenovibrio sp.]